MRINLTEIMEKAYNDLNSLTNIEAAIFDWVNSYRDGSIDMWKLEENEVFKDCVEDILIWRLRFERDFHEEYEDKWMKKYMGLKAKYDNFISVCNDIFRQDRDVY